MHFCKDTIVLPYEKASIERMKILFLMHYF
jgi:hypothetical protein